MQHADPSGFEYPDSLFGDTQEATNVGQPLRPGRCETETQLQDNTFADRQAIDSALKQDAKDGIVTEPFGPSPASRASRQAHDHRASLQKKPSRVGQCLTRGSEGPKRFQHHLSPDRACRPDHVCRHDRAGAAWQAPSPPRAPCR